MKRIQHILRTLGIGYLGGAIALLLLWPTPAWSAPDTHIHAIQGAAHQSPFATPERQIIQDVPGIVTVILDKGFYLQDPDPDTNDATSEGIYVFTNNIPKTSEGELLGIGDGVRVTGTVVEFTPGGRNSNNLSTTQIDASVLGTDGGAEIVRDSIDNPLPLPVVLGQGDRLLPNTVIEDDGFQVFDPDSDGIDFFESLEGMLIQVNDAIVVEPTNRYDEFIVLGDEGTTASTLSPLGGVVISNGDLNPERIWIKNTSGATPKVHVGDRFERPIVGVLGYSFGNYKLFTTQPLPPVEEVNTTPDVTTLVNGDEQLTIAEFNVENLDPSDGKRFDAIAQRIIDNLQAPDILALIEVQDNNGTGESGSTEADQTYRALIEAIQQIGGPDYAFTDVAPAKGQDGGQPGGNIRVGFIYRPDRVTLEEQIRGEANQAVQVIAGTDGPTLSMNPGRIDPTNAAFEDSRKPLAAQFLFNGESVFVIANHFNSKRGDRELFGKTQPPDFPSEVQRTQQAAVVHQFVEEILAVDADANVVVVGDFNDFQFSDALQTLAGDELQNLIELLPVGDRYTYLYQGNLQALDHSLVSQHPLFDGSAEFDIVHVNVGFPDEVSDHDPILMRFTIPKPAEERNNSDSGNSDNTEAPTLEDTDSGTTNPDVTNPDATNPEEDNGSNGGNSDDTETPNPGNTNPDNTNPDVIDPDNTNPGTEPIDSETSLTQNELFISILPNERGRSLLNQLATDYAPKRSLGYNTGRDILYGQIDNEDGVVEGIYTGYQVQLNPNARPRSDAFAKGINAEHSWPQSKGAKGPAKSDLHHLFPSRIRVNGTRGNNPFADIPDAQTDRWFRDDKTLRSMPTGDIDDYSEFDPGAFEPREQKKGDIARAMFYFYTIYEAQADAADASFFPRQRETLCEWHQFDPADAKEVTRSHAIAQTAQGNENPFVLDPSLAERTYCP